MSILKLVIFNQVAEPTARRDTQGVMVGPSHDVYSY